MSTTFANQINNLDIYAARAVADKDGNQLDTTYAKSSDLATVATTGDYADLSNKPTIPAALSAGDGVDITNNVVSAKVDGTTIVVNQNTGELEALIGESDVFIAEYNVTPYDDIDAAIQANKSVFLKYPHSESGDPYSLIPFVLKNEYISTIRFQGFYDNWSVRVVTVKKDISVGTTIWSMVRYHYQPSTQFDSSLTYSYDSSTSLGSLSVTNPLPSSSASDADKVLTVDSQGAPGWTTPSVPTVDQTFDGTSTNAQSGVAIAGELANYTPTSSLATVATSGDYDDLSNKPTIRNVPASTSADATKVLTVDANGDAGWAAPAGLFEAIYGQTSYADIVSAINAHKIVYCRISATGASRMAFLAYIGTSNVEFQYYRSLNSHSAANQTDEVYVYTVSSSGWTTTTRLAGIKYEAGTNMTSSFANNTLTFQSVWPTVDQTYDSTSTNAQSGTAVAGALANFALGDVSSIQQVNALPANPDASTLYLIPVT